MEQTYFPSRRTSCKSIAPAKANLRNIPRNLTQRVSPVPLEPAPPGNHLFQAFAALCLVFLMSQVMVDVWRNHTDAAAVKAGKLPRQLAGDEGGRARCVYLLLLCHPKILRKFARYSSISVCVRQTCLLLIDEMIIPNTHFWHLWQKVASAFYDQNQNTRFLFVFFPVYFGTRICAIRLCRTCWSLGGYWCHQQEPGGSPWKQVEVLGRRFRLS